jgi:hypothetical protein
MQAMGRVGLTPDVHKMLHLLHSIAATKAGRTAPAALHFNDDKYPFNRLIILGPSSYYV